MQRWLEFRPLNSSHLFHRVSLEHDGDLLVMADPRLSVTLSSILAESVYILSLNSLLCCCLMNCKSPFQTPLFSLPQELHLTNGKAYVPQETLALQWDKRMDDLKYQNSQGSANEIKFCFFLSFNKTENKLDEVVNTVKTGFLFLIKVSKKVSRIQPGDFKQFLYI